MAGCVFGSIEIEIDGGGDDMDGQVRQVGDRVSDKKSTTSLLLSTNYIKSIQLIFLYMM